MAWAMSPSLAAQKRPVEFFLPTAVLTLPATMSAFTFADCTTWSGSSNGNAGFNLNVGCTKFRSVVMVKNMLAGASTGNALPILTLEVSDSAGMTNNRVMVDAKPVYSIDGQLGVATSMLYHYTLEGSLLNTTKQYAAVYFRVPTGNTNFAGVGAVTFDGWIDATP